MPTIGVGARGAYGARGPVKGGTMRAGKARWVGRSLVAGLVVAIGVAVLPSAAMAAPTTTRISSDPGGGPGDSGSNFAAVNASGRYVAFASGASNLLPGDTNDTLDMFLRDRRSRTTICGPDGWSWSA